MRSRRVQLHSSGSKADRSADRVAARRFDRGADPNGGRARDPGFGVPLSKRNAIGLTERQQAGKIGLSRASDRWMRPDLDVPAICDPRAPLFP